MLVKLGTEESSGIAKLPNGTMIQYNQGYVTSGSSFGDVSIYFSEAFKSTPSFCCSLRGDTSAGDYKYYGYRLHEESSTKVQVIIVNQDGEAYHGRKVFISWVAIGRWK